MYLAFICFNEQSLLINENQESVTFTLNISNPSLTDEVITVIITNGTATGELIIVVYIYVATLYSCNMGKSGLPDIYTRSTGAAGLRAEGVYIRQTTSTHVTTIM